MTRYILLASVMVVATFAVGLGLRKLMFTDATPTLTASSPPPSAAKSSQLTVSRLQGRVELSEGGGGSWSPLSPNARLSEKARVRTNDGASAVLSADDGLQVEVSPESQVELVSAQQKDTMLVVERGRLFARVAARAGALRVGVDGSDALVRTSDAAFAVLRDDGGQVAVAVTEGAVALSAQQTNVKVGAGEQSVVPLKRAPTAPARIPSSLFLKVTRAGPDRLNRKSTDVGGETNPGAIVFVNGAPVAVEADGRFSARVPLQEGKNALNVTVRDALGRSEQKQLAPVVVDTQPPKLKGKTIW